MILNQNINRDPNKKYSRNPSVKSRWIKKPRYWDFSRHLKTHSSEYSSRLYTELQPYYILWVYIRNILPAAIPALLLNGFFIYIHFISLSITPDVPIFTRETLILIFIGYSICIYFGLKKAKDHMAYYNRKLVNEKSDINRKYLMELRKSNDIKNNKKAAVINHYRKKINKQLLFPNPREIAAEQQLRYINKNHRNRVEKHMSPTEIAMMYSAKLDINVIRSEHMAAKEIANLEYAHHGGTNEYEVMTAKYKDRTIPTIRNIIEDIM